MISRLVRMMEGSSVTGWRFVFGIGLGAMTVAMHWPNLKLGPPRAGIRPDLALHAIAFGGLSGLMMLARVVPNLPRAFSTRNIWWCSILTLIYGVGTEFTQEYLISGRQMSSMDFLANITGVITAGLIARYVFARVTLNG